LTRQLEEATQHITELTSQLVAVSEEKSELQREADCFEATLSDLWNAAASRTAERSRFRSSARSSNQEVHRSSNAQDCANADDGADAEAGYTPFLVTRWHHGE
jgi:hypothetical protein